MCVHIYTEISTLKGLSTISVSYLK